jgi:5'-deoxynucleotidase YfbR-like HD superfamily hydrolase
MSHFFAYLSRMKFIRRWGLMRSTYPENIQEHSLRVALIAHALAVIRNRLFVGGADPERTALLALYHDVGEVLTGALPTPVKQFNPEIKTAYGSIEAAARDRLFGMIPDRLKPDYEALFRLVRRTESTTSWSRRRTNYAPISSVWKSSMPAIRSSPKRRRHCGPRWSGSSCPKCAISSRLSSLASA